MVVIRYENGKILAKGGKIPFGIRDDTTGDYRTPAIRYPNIVDFLKKRGVDYTDNVDKSPQVGKLSSQIRLRDYQREALEAWTEAGMRGIIVLPTGAGKTVVAMKIIEEMCMATLIVVPTIVLLEQWRQELQSEFGIPVGILGGGKANVMPITVTTYDSASIRAFNLGNRFQLLIFDEVHHLPAKSYRSIALSYIAPYRLGLTATIGKNPQVHEDLSLLVGRVVYEIEVDELTGHYLSDYAIQTIHIPLTEEENAEYNKLYTHYRNFLQRRGIKIRSVRDYQRFVLRTVRDNEARKAFLARNRAMDLAQNSSSKIKYLKALLERNRDEKTLIFTRHNKLVYKISREMLIPAITHQTPRQERDEILEGFKSGKYMRLITSQVLDEGIDVPDASLAVILSGTGSSRQFIQRLGRVLRRKESKRARLVELVSEGTAETKISKRRRRE